jgi:hypothetical protein
LEFHWVLSFSMFFFFCFWRKKNLECSFQVVIKLSNKILICRQTRTSTKNSFSSLHNCFARPREMCMWFLKVKIYTLDFPLLLTFSKSAPCCDDQKRCSIFFLSFLLFFGVCCEVFIFWVLWTCRKDIVLRD